MDLAEAFRNHREKIVNKWVEYTLSTYESSSFFKRERDKFANPVGGNTREALNTLFGLLAKGAETEELLAPLEQVILIRSIQDMAPSVAVGVIHAVKHITREVLGKDKERAHLVAELYDFEFAVDLAVLAAFDLYMQCRERLYQVRIKEIKTGTHILTESKCPSSLLKDTVQPIDPGK
ncbi:MAG: RsbRD N-terminal domain-containing protein [Thermodesulfobacteriota bacterium]